MFVRNGISTRTVSTTSIHNDCRGQYWLQWTDSDRFVKIWFQVVSDKATFNSDNTSLKESNFTRVIFHDFTNGNMSFFLRPWELNFTNEQRKQFKF